ncbi:MAG: 1-deoxy-D-xylulose-5-phosphate reductoisomerase [Vampirovibrio sp.]|nr:1-deoxy-D-xylulose-5-phosphate reductoisomerase [Vampirovibrio sp.]
MSTPPTPQPIALLGSTGSIGTQALEVLQQFPDRYRITALAAGNNLERLAAQVDKFRPKMISIQDPDRILDLKTLLAETVPSFDGEILAGEDGLLQIAEHSTVDTVIIGLVGFTGVTPTLAALEAGKQVLTANKETFVTAGHLVATYLDQIIPLDSEHSAIHQCLKNESASAVHKIYLTASGGPFRNMPLNEMNNVTPTMALKHPNWIMGQKVTIDSATMMNKGLEVIEAKWLFGMTADQIQVVIHPQSIVHSGVEYVDGSVLMQLGTPDMRVPIQYGLGYPDRLPGNYLNSRLDLLTMGALTFEPPDLKRFPCLALAYEACRQGSHAATVVNAADEVLVALFLDNKIGFMDIPRFIEKVLTLQQAWEIPAYPDIETLKALDQRTRHILNELVGPVQSVV